MTETFTGNFTQQEPIPDEGIAAAMAVSGCAEGVAFGPPTPGGSASAY